MEGEGEGEKEITRLLIALMSVLEEACIPLLRTALAEVIILTGFRASKETHASCILLKVPPVTWLSGPGSLREAAKMTSGPCMLQPRGGRKRLFQGLHSFCPPAVSLMQSDRGETGRGRG